MFESLSRCYPLLGIVHEDLPQQIKEVPIEAGGGRDEFLLKVSQCGDTIAVRVHTDKCFIAFTYFLEALEVSLLG